MPMLEQGLKDCHDAGRKTVDDVIERIRQLTVSPENPQGVTMDRPSFCVKKSNCKKWVLTLLSDKRSAVLALPDDDERRAKILARINLKEKETELLFKMQRVVGTTSEGGQSDLFANLFDGCDLDE